MIREKIGFKNAKSLLFQSNLDDLFSNYQNKDYIQEEINSYQTNNIRSVYFLTSGSTSQQEDIKNSLTSYLNPEKIGLFEIPLSILDLSQFEDFLEICRSIQHQIKEGSCLFIYSERKSHEIEIFASMFMLTLKSMRSIGPEYAIEYIVGENKHREDFDIIFDFKKFLNPTYEIPELRVPESEIIAMPITSPNQATEKVKPITSIKEPKKESPQKTEKKESAPIVLEKKQKTEKKTRAPFKNSRFSIKVKLLSIITGILIVSLSSMIFIASKFFQEETQRSIQANNLNLAETIAGRVEKELSNIGYKAHQIALSIEQGIGSQAQQQLNLNLFFQNNKDFLFLGIANKKNQSLHFSHLKYNKETLSNLGLSIEDIKNINNRMNKHYEPSLNGAFLVHNVSEGLSTPLLGITLPLHQGTIIVLYLDPSQFLNSFKTRGVKAFMVNKKGDVIAHQDSKLVLINTNLAKLGIVKAYLNAKQSNGLTQYKDENGVGFLGSFKIIKVGDLGVITTVEEKKAFAAVAKILQTNIIITLVIVILAFIIIYLFSKSMSEPIKELAQATSQIEQGNYDINISPITRDEIGFLTHSFDHMAEGLAERERAKDALGRFVNKQVAELALSGDINLGGETKEAAVFFSDLRGFTAMSEKMTPEEVVSYLNEYFTGMVDAVLDTHGIVDKFIGDAVMAHWGAFGSTGNNTENAINCGLIMRTAIIEFNIRGDDKRPFAKQGCGINSGPVVSGQIGSEARFEFTVIGDTVNLAARIEALNKPFGTDILISQESYNLVGGTFKVEPMPAIKVKGKEEPQIIYAVIGRNDDPNCPKDLKQVRDMLGIEFDESKEIDADAKEEKFEVVGK